MYNLFKINAILYMSVARTFLQGLGFKGRRTWMVKCYSCSDVQLQESCFYLPSVLRNSFGTIHCHQSFLCVNIQTNEAKISFTTGFLDAASKTQIR